jgi:hypothetical protein
MYSKEFSKNKSNSSVDTTTLLQYTVSVGDSVAKRWSQQDDSWELNVSVEQIKGDRK